MSVDEAKLQKFLLKCELEYRAKHSQQAACLDWLAPHCGSVTEISQFLRELGFKIKNIVMRSRGREKSTSGWKQLLE